MGTLPDRPVVAIDIDNTIGDYTNHFARFAREWLGEDLWTREYGEDYDWDNDYEGEFSLALGLDKATYREIKLAYRQGGSKRTMPLFPGAKELVEMVHEMGAEVWFCSTRPWQRLDNIDPDTREFFRRNGLEFNGLIYGDDKYADLVSIVGADRIVCVLDDLPEQIIKAQELGLNAILRTGDHNRWWYPPMRELPDPMPYMFNNLAGADIHVERLISQWKEEHMPKYQGPGACGHEGCIEHPPAWFSDPDKSVIPPDEMEAVVGIPRLAMGTMLHVGARETGKTNAQNRVVSVDNIFDEARSLYIQKAAGYGNTADTLGAKGQFADMNRKWGKMRQMLWDETLPLYPDAPNEDIEQILMDMMGHAALTIDFLREARGNKGGVQAPAIKSTNPWDAAQATVREQKDNS